MRRYLKANDKVTLEMQHTYAEQQSSMNEMIKQVALLADIMKGIRVERVRSKGNEQREDEEGIRELEEKKLSNDEQESQISLEKQEEVQAFEARSAEEESPAEAYLTTTPFQGGVEQGIPEETSSEPQELEEEVMEPSVKLDATLFYLQTRTVHGLDGEMKRQEAKTEGESALAGKPPHVIDKPDEYREEEGQG